MKHTELFDDVIIKKLTTHRDDRGAVTEFFREEWLLNESKPVQFNLTSSKQYTLRGMHLHLEHTDYLVAVQGVIEVILLDLRKNSQTYKQAKKVLLNAECLSLLIIPPRVAHAFYFPADATYCYGLSSYWNSSNDLGCRFTDPEIGIAPSGIVKFISERDKNASSLSELINIMELL